MWSCEESLGTSVERKKRKLFREAGDHYAQHLDEGKGVNRVLMCMCVLGGVIPTQYQVTLQTPAECSTIQLSSDAAFLEIALDPVG